MNTTHNDYSILSIDNNTLTIFEDNKNIQNIIENLKYKDTIQNIVIKNNMKKLNLTSFLSVVKIECFGNNIERLYCNSNCKIVELGKDSLNPLIRYKY